MTNDDNPMVQPYKVMTTEPEWFSISRCKLACESDADCQAFDYYNATRQCNLYQTPCISPTYYGSENPCSFQMAQGCNVHNGSTGVLIRGHCNTNISLPGYWSVVKECLWNLLHSPRSWAISCAVALVYSILVSRWLQEKLGIISCLRCWHNFRSKASPTCKCFIKILKVALWAVLIAGWCRFLVSEW